MIGWVNGIGEFFGGDGLKLEKMSCLYWGITEEGHSYM